MPKLTIPKNTWIDEVKLEFADEGFWHGTYMLTLAFSGGAYPGDEFLAGLLANIGQQKLPSRKIVRLTGLFSPTDRGIGLLVKMLYDHGYQLQIVLREIPELSWLPYFSWIIFRTSKTLVPMAFDELLYEPPELDVIPEPQLPKPRRAANGAIMPQYLYLKRQGSMTATTRFICESPLNWQLA